MYVLSNQDVGDAARSRSAKPATCRFSRSASRRCMVAQTVLERCGGHYETGEPLGGLVVISRHGRRDVLGSSACLLQSCPRLTCISPSRPPCAIYRSSGLAQQNQLFSLTIPADRGSNAPAALILAALLVWLPKQTNDVRSPLRGRKRGALWRLHFRLDLSCRASHPDFLSLASACSLSQPIRASPVVPPPAMIDCRFREAVSDSVGAPGRQSHTRSTTPKSC